MKTYEGPVWKRKREVNVKMGLR